jgi:hypothetical protein
MDQESKGGADRRALAFIAFQPAAAPAFVNQVKRVAFQAIFNADFAEQPAVIFSRLKISAKIPSSSFWL